MDRGIVFKDMHVVIQKSDNKLKSSLRAKEKSNSTFFSKETFFQPKLIIGAVNDPYEREADSVANKVMKMDNSEQMNIQSGMFPIRIQRKCSVCDEEENIQRKENGQAKEEVPSAVGRAINDGGNPLDQATRSLMESRIGYDFSQVKIHTGSVAAKSAESINALAYTSGNDIVFNEGQYAPQTKNGKRLLAHELTHVVQQRSRSAVASPVIMRQPDNKKKKKTDLVTELKKNELFKSLPKSAQEKIIEAIEDAPFTLAQQIAEKAIDLAPIDADLKEGLKKVVEGILTLINKSEPPKVNPCDHLPDWHLGGSTAFKGMCCSTPFESEKTCCPPHKAAPLEGRCCSDSETVQGGKCVEIEPIINICPGGTFPALNGECCFAPEVNIGGLCMEPPVPQKPPPKPPSKPALTIEKESHIGFIKDAPQFWFDPSASYGVSVTEDGKTAFENLLLFLKENPKAKVQIDGHASSEKPANDPKYNERLTVRRAKLIRSELIKRGISETRIKNIPSDPDTQGCTELLEGTWSCGDTKAQEAVEASDRNVTVKIFSI